MSYRIKHHDGFFGGHWAILDRYGDEVGRADTEEEARKLRRKFNKQDREAQHEGSAGLLDWLFG